MTGAIVGPRAGGGKPAGRAKLRGPPWPSPPDMSRHGFDPTTIGDPIATRTEWKPAASGGSNFGTHRLRATGTDRMEFRASGGAKLFALVFVFAGVVGGGLFTTIGLLEDPGLAYFGLPIGLLFTGVGTWLLRRMTTPRVFDAGRGYYWRSRQDPQALAPSELDQRCSLDEIHAVQLLAEHCSSSNGGGYFSYELNLVLKDASRRNVIDHGHLGDIRRDASALAAFLGVPVWDATG